MTISLYFSGNRSCVILVRLFDNGLTRTYRYPSVTTFRFWPGATFFLHVILRIPRTNPPPHPLRTHNLARRVPKASTASLKNIDSCIELDVRTKYFYIAVIPSSSFFFFLPLPPFPFVIHWRSKHPSATFFTARITRKPS